MKRNLFLSLLALVFISCLVSFTIIKKTAKPVAATKAKTTIKKPTKFSCSGVTTSITQTGSYTFTWTVSGGYDHFRYGGYYQAGGQFSGDAACCSVTIPAVSGGGRIGITPVCSDGSFGTSYNIGF